MDPGIEDAVALCLALAEPQLEVLAVTATGGNVPPDQATRNVQAIVEQLDPPHWPRIGAASSEQTLRADSRHFFGEGGFCGVELPVAELHHRHLSVKVICEEVRAAPGEVTLLAIGPLSNIAAALQREPDLAPLLGHLIMLGGTLAGPGNITPAAEFNVFCDAEAARIVFRSPVTKTIVPIDVARQVVLDYDLLAKLSNENSRSGELLRQILPGSFHAHRQRMGIEGIYVNDVVAVVAALCPELFETESMHGDVETEGALTHGATVFDRRHLPDEQPNMDVVVSMDVRGVTDCILQGIVAG